MRTTDACNQLVFNVLFQVLHPLSAAANPSNLSSSLLMNTVYLAKVDYSAVSQCLMQTFANICVDFQKIILFVTDMILPQVDKAVSLMKKVLVKAPSRRSRFLFYLQNCEKTKVTVPPEPVVTRCNTWFNAVVYHAKYIDLYANFVDSEIREETKTAALETLHDLL